MKPPRVSAQPCERCATCAETRDDNGQPRAGRAGFGAARLQRAREEDAGLVGGAGAGRRRAPQPSLVRRAVGGRRGASPGEGARPRRPSDRPALVVPGWLRLSSRRDRGLRRRPGLPGAGVLAVSPHVGPTHSDPSGASPRRLGSRPFSPFPAFSSSRLSTDDRRGARGVPRCAGGGAVREDAPGVRVRPATGPGLRLISQKRTPVPRVPSSTNTGAPAAGESSAPPAANTDQTETMVNSAVVTTPPP